MIRKLLCFLGFHERRTISMGGITQYQTHCICGHTEGELADKDKMYVYGRMGVMVIKKQADGMMAAVITQQEDGSIRVQL